MIKVVKNETSYKLYDTKQNAFVENNMQNRLKAFFYVLLDIELTNNKKFTDDYRNIEELAKNYENCLSITNGGNQKVDEVTVGAFLYIITLHSKVDDEKLELLYQDYFNNLIHDIIEDYRKVETQEYIYYKSFAKEFAYLAKYNYVDDDNEEELW